MRRLRLCLLALALAVPSVARGLTVTVVRDRAPVMDGPKTIALVTKGTRLTVARTQGPWYGVHVRVHNRVVFGWVHQANVRADQPGNLEAQAQAAFQRLKAKAEQLAQQGKYKEAIAVLDSFPPRFRRTTWQNRIIELSIEIERRAAHDPQRVNAEAEAEFRTRKGQAESLVQQGRLAQAIQALQGYPAKYAKTPWAEQLEQYRKALETRLRAPVRDIHPKIQQHVRAGDFDGALRLLEQTCARRELPKTNPHVRATWAYIEHHRAAAARPGRIFADPLAADPYGADPEYRKALGKFVRVIVPAKMRRVNLRYGLRTVSLRVPTLEEQIADGKELLTQYPWSASVHLHLARALARGGKLQAAHEHYRKAIELDLHHSRASLDASLEAARLHLRHKQPDRAVEILTASLRRVPDDFLALAALGEAHLAAGRRDAGVAACRKSLKLNPEQPRLAALLKTTQGQPPEAAAPKELKLTELVQRVEESCVLIRRGPSAGSGYAISADGLIATNFHVVAVMAGHPIRVLRKRAGKSVTIVDVEPVLVAPVHDIALLRVDPRHHPFRPLRLGSAKSVLAGEQIVVIGNPGMGGLILDHTITRGIVSNRDRVFNRHAHHIQTDAAINRGNSGGPMLNMRGEVVGMVTLKASKIERTGFALHIDHVRDVLPHCFPQCRWPGEAPTKAARASGAVAPGREALPSLLAPGGPAACVLSGECRARRP